jgi:hypothetical protein
LFRGTLQRFLGNPEDEGIILKAAPVIAVGQGKGTDVEVGPIGHVYLSMPGIGVPVVEDIGDVDVKDLTQFRVRFGTGIDEGIDTAFPGNGNTVQKAGFITVYRIPLRGTVGIVILRTVGVTGRLREENRANPRFFADIEVKTSVHLLFYPEVIPL